MKKILLVLIFFSICYPKSKYVKEEDVKRAKSIIIDKNKEIKKIEKEKNVISKQKKLVSEYKVQNLNPSEVISNLNGLFNVELRQVDDNILIYGDKDEILKFKAMIYKLDKKKSQIIVRLNIIDTSYNLFDRLGFNWKLENSKNNIISEFFNNKLSLANLINLGGNSLGVDIDALKEKGELKIRSSPEILIIEGGQGELKVTNEMIVNMGNKGNEIKNYEAGLIFKVKPKIVYKSYNKYIQMEIYAELSNFISSKSKSQNIIKTEMIVKDNGSVFIGGVNNESYRVNESGIKGFSDIPIFGTFFKKKNNVKEKRNLYLEIEAKISE